MAAHIALTKSEETRQVCIPLSEVGINTFIFVRSFADNSLTMLTTRPDWTEHFLKQQYYHISTFEQSPMNYNSGFILWNSIDEDKARESARRYFNFSNGLSLIDKQDDYCDIFHFCVNNDNKKINNIYINNLDFFKHFSIYFKERASLLIKESIKHKIYRHNSNDEQKKITSILDDSYLRIDNAKLMGTKSNEFSIKNQYQSIKLTQRECICVAWLILGKSSYEVAMILGIAKKTVESHIENVKIKLDCYKQTYLVYKLLLLGFDPNLFI